MQQIKHVIRNAEAIREFIECEHPPVPEPFMDQDASPRKRKRKGSGKGKRYHKAHALTAAAGYQPGYPYGKK